MKRFVISIFIWLPLVSLCLDANVAFSQASKSIQQAAVDGNLDEVKALLAKGTDVNLKNRQGYTPLHAGARHGRKAVVELLIDKGADINSKEANSKTALFLAAEYGRKEIVELLLAKGVDVNVATGGGENALSIAKKTGNTEIADLLVKKGATEPKAQDMYGDRYYGGEDMLPPGAGVMPPRGAVRGAASPAPEVDLLADPNEIMARLKTFDGLEKAIADLAAKSASETRYWGQSRYDNRTSLARAVQKQVEDELAVVKKIAVEEKTTKTTEAIDALVKQKQARYKKVNNELLQQKREASQAQSSRAGARGRTSGRSPSRGGRPSSGWQMSGGVTGGTAYDGGDGSMAGTDRFGRPIRPAEQLDSETQDEIRQWLQTTMDNKPDLAKSIHPKIHAEFALIRQVAVEEEAKKTTAVVDGILLARQVRFDVYIKTVEALRSTVAPGQDPRLAGRGGTTRGGVGATQQQNTQRGGRTRRR